ncbi:uncharacterized protein BDW47DRAFT_65088 [Aspergillus candidus]|uniref:Uncharacterized protein n=1 Tax=Aspergillus candidus TaxID=41067 RepID=A0A2I2FKM4_ASPCN|nr:hypothetical protein BDW47DRAFT_65088 [Aspergillus candidus]PLB41187.1 hypothetical protein BDW47DRAFT_65088 [Aspergillus candidus]
MSVGYQCKGHFTNLQEKVWLDFITSAAGASAYFAGGGRISSAWKTGSLFRKSRNACCMSLDFKFAFFFFFFFIVLNEMCMTWGRIRVKRTIDQALVGLLDKSV